MFISKAYRAQAIMSCEIHKHTLAHTAADAHFTVDRRCWSGVQTVLIRCSLAPVQQQ